MSVHLAKLWSYIKGEGFAADGVCTRVVWFKAAHSWQLGGGGFHEGMLVGNLIQVEPSGSGTDGGHQRFKHRLALLARRRIV